MALQSTRPWRYSSAVEVDKVNRVIADPEKQNFTVVAESVYFSMKLKCKRCREEFWFSASEQQAWYEEWGFWIDSVPKHCSTCRKLLRQEHGRE